MTLTGLPESASLRARGPLTRAGGLKSVLSALSHIYRALGFRHGTLALTQINQPRGFDCPGCAWPTSAAAASRLDFCENGAKALAAEAGRKAVGAEFFSAWSIAALAAQSDQWLERQGRLTTPMIRLDGATHYTPASYEQAYALIARRMQALAGPDQAVFYTCGHVVNEAAFLFQLLARQFGSNNLPSSINLCHEPSGKALQASLGHTKGDARPEDIEQADAIFLFGHNPGSNHPRMLRTLDTAVRRGAVIVAVNPMLEAGLRAFADPKRATGLLGRSTPLARLHLPVRIGGDLALIKGMIKQVLKAEAGAPGTILDHAFIDQYCAGFGAFATAIERTTWAEIEASSGVPRTLIEAAAQIYIEAERVVCSWGLGVTQHRNGTETVRELVNLMLLRGQIGRAGTGLCPMRGHSNILGIRSMGAGERMPEPFLSALEDATGLSIPRKPGWHAVEAIRAMQSGRARALLCLGGNLAASAPDSSATESALRSTDLSVQVSTTLNRSHAHPGRTAVILPCLARSERELIAGRPQSALIEDMAGGVHSSQGPLPPIDSRLRGETRIIAELGAALFGQRSPVPWTEYAEDYTAVRQLIGKVVAGYRDAAGWGNARAGAVLPNPIRERRFGGSGGRARFAANPLPETDDRGQDALRLMTIRSHDQFNTCIQDANDRYRGLRGARRAVLLNPEDMRRLAISPTQRVWLRPVQTASTRTEEAFLAVPYPIPQGCAAAYFPEANRITDLDALDRSTGTPASKSVRISITPG